MLPANTALAAFADLDLNQLWEVIERQLVESGIPEAAELITVIPFGYPTDEEKTKKKVRKRLEKIAYREHYGQPY